MHLPDKKIYLGSVGLCAICLSVLWYLGMQRDNSVGAQALRTLTKPYTKTMADGRKIAGSMLYAEVWAPKTLSANDIRKFSNDLVEQQLRQVAERQNEDVIFIKLFNSKSLNSLEDQEYHRQEIYYREKGSWINVTAKLKIPQLP